MRVEQIIARWAEDWRTLRAWGRPLTEVQYTYRRYAGHAALGYACASTREITIYWRARDLAGTLKTVVHELAHCAAPGQVHHGPQWRRVYAQAITEITGQPVAHDLPQAVIDAQAADAMRAWWRASGNELAAGLLLPHLQSRTGR